jgi:hypothetical protein
VLKPEDLPEGWEIVRQLSGDESEARELETVGHLEDFAVDRIQMVEWYEIRHDDGTRAIIRIAPVNEEHFSHAVTTAIVMSADSKSMLQRQALANVPAVSISRAISARWSARAKEILRLYGGALSANLGPLPKFERTDDFYKEVAKHWLAAYWAEDPSPTDRVMDASGASKSTAQRWVAEARKRGFIPQGLTGKPGRR